MDHLPSLNGCGSYKNIEIPYLCKEEYDREGFSGYPLRQGWDKTKILAQGDFGSERPLKDIQSFLQTWLYFGLLSEVLGIYRVQVETSHFLRKVESGAQYITSEPLQQMATLWGDGEMNLRSKEQTSKTGQQTRLRLVTAILEEACDWANTFCAYKGPTVITKPTIRSSHSPLPPEVSMSISALGDSLNHAKMLIWNLYGTPALGLWWGDSEYIIQRILQAGWCPFDIHRLRNFKTIDCQYTLLCQYYCSTFPAPRRNGDHSSCQVELCLVDQINEDHYKTKHTKPWCRCNSVEPCQYDVINILESGAVPLVEYKHRIGDSEPELEVIKNQAGIRYVAISHVWADGLGNVRTNALPQCQLSRLQSLVNALYQHDAERDFQPIAFWIDTLCIPVDPTAHKEINRYRKKAIRMMSRIYAEADKVLVLDSDIAQGSRSASCMENFARIALSRWMTRLWTLQESVFANRLYFQYDDGPLSLSYLTSLYIPRIWATGVDFHAKVISTLAEYCRRLLPKSSHAYSKPEENIRGFWSALQWRSTSKPADETICLATLLNIDTTPLLGLPEPLRIPHFLHMLGRVPPGIIFLPGPRFVPGPRVEENGLRWAPKTWMTRNEGRGGQIEPFLREEPLVPLNPRDGSLTVKYPGFVLQGSPRATEQTFFITKPGDFSQFWKVALPDNDNQGRKLVGVPLQGFAIILSRPINDLFGHTGVLATRGEGYNDYGLRVTLFCSLHIELMAAEACTVLRRWWQGLVDADDLDPPHPMFPVYIEEMLEDQKWCIN
jgi:hypothetical protein